MSEATDAQKVIEALEQAFGRETAPPIGELIAPRFRSSADADEAEVAIKGKRWTELDADTLFFHRESLGMLSATGYRAYVAAFMRASFEAGAKYAPDLVGYAVSSLHPLSDADDDVDLVRERISLLTTDQRDAIALYLRHLVSEYQDDDAKRILKTWSSPRSTPKTGP